MGSIRDWDDVIEHLSTSRHCLSMDLPGHGKSLRLADDSAYTMPGASQGIVEVMKRVGIGPASIVGYSMGGRLALYLATHYRHMCSRLIVESASAGIVSDSEREERLKLDEEKARELEEGEFEDFLRTWYCQPVFATMAEDPKKLERVLRRRRLNDPRELARSLRGMSVGAQAPLWASLSDLAMPVCLIAGERDGKYVDIVRSMAALMPDVRVEIIEEVGHNVHWENPSAVSECIRNFL
jgi:2-succinyl-6-hydroxy-2,4-cyclohexadiene-1-carboxylate synthase